jgi:hypothetical protein
MTTVTYNRDTDTFKVESEHGTRYVPYAVLNAFTDQDLRDCMRQAIDCAGDVITVPKRSYARGLRPRASVRHGVIQ